MEVEKGTTGTPTTTATPVAKSSCKCMMIGVSLRFLLLASCVVAVVVMATSKQTKMMPVPNVPGLTVPVPAKFSHSPAFIYFMVALSVAGLYSIITIIASFSYMSKPFPAKMFLILAAHDVIILGIVAAATGAAGGVAYIGLKGNTHVQWDKICNKYDKFCSYITTSICNSLLASVVLVFLIILNIYSLYKRG